MRLPFPLSQVLSMMLCDDSGVGEAERISVVYLLTGEGKVEGCPWLGFVGFLVS